MWKVDLKIFFKESWKKYGFVFLLVLVQCVGFRNLIQQYNTVNGQEWKLHFWDYVICFFQGTVPYAQSEGYSTVLVFVFDIFCFIDWKTDRTILKKIRTANALTSEKQKTVVDGNSFENLAGMYGISGSDSNSISCFFFL